MGMIMAVSRPLVYLIFDGPLDWLTLLGRSKSRLGWADRAPPLGRSG